MNSIHSLFATGQTWPMPGPYQPAANGHAETGPIEISSTSYHAELLHSTRLHIPGLELPPHSPLKSPPRPTYTYTLPPPYNGEDPWPVTQQPPTHFQHNSECHETVEVHGLKPAPSRSPQRSAGHSGFAGSEEWNSKGDPDSSVDKNITQQAVSCTGKSH